MAPVEARLLHSLAIMPHDLHPFIVILRNVPQFCRQQRNIKKVGPINEDKFIFQTLFGEFTVLLSSVLSRHWQITKEAFSVLNSHGRIVHAVITGGKRFQEDRNRVRTGRKHENFMRSDWYVTFLLARTWNRVFIFCCPWFVLPVCTPYNPFCAEYVT